MGKVAAASGAGIAVLGAAWVGAGAWGAQRAEQELSAWAARSAGHDGVRLMNLRHDRGLLSSSGSVDVRFEDACSDAAGGDQPVTLQVTYKLQHLILPGSLMRFEWSVAPAGEAGAAFAKAFGGNTRLQGQGSMAMSGELQSTLALPELVVNGAESVRMAPSTGTIRWGDNTFGLSWATDRVVLRGHGQAFEAQKLSLELDLKNRRLGAGTASFAVESMSAGAGTAEGLKLTSEVVERGDRLDMSFKPSLRKLDVAGQTARDLMLDVGITGVHAASIETLGQIVGDTCGLEHTTAAEAQKLRGALRTALARGFTLGITKIGGSIGNGSIDGMLQVRIDPTTGGPDAPILLAKVLRSQATLTIKGDAIGPDQKQMAIAMGAATEVPGGLQGSFEYAEGLLKVNGRSFDGGDVHQALATADRHLNGFLSSNEQIALAPAVVPATAPAVETLSAAAPADAPAAEAPPAQAPAR